MPSPIGHMLAGVAAGWAVAGAPAETVRGGDRPGRRVPAWAHSALPFAILGAAPDLDLLVGRHSMYTHSVGAALAVFVVAYIVARRRTRSEGPARRVAPAVYAAACAAAMASHILLDWLGSDTTPPIGIMALWPFSNAYYQSSWFVFDAISRRVWDTSFYVNNARAALREIVLLLPLTWIIWWIRVKSRVGAR